MANREESFNKRRLRSSYLSVVVSISLVLFVLGVFGLLLLNANEIARKVKENFAITLLLENETSPANLSQFQKSLALEEHVKSVQFISKEEGAAQLKADLDEDFVNFLGYNPLHDALEVRLKADYVQEATIQALAKQYEGSKIIHKVVYDKPLIQKMNENIERISLFLAVGSLLLSLVAIALINSSIRLAIYSRRFLIKTMQLVGATKGFIRRPFILRSLRHGIYGALVACGLLGVLVYYLDRNIPGLQASENYVDLSILGGSIVLAGVLISMACTFFALRKYLKLKTDQLYY